MKRGRERREREIKNNFLPLLPFGTAPVLPGARRVPGLRDETGTAIVLITHDLGVVAEMADRVVVMYAGQVVEQAPVGELFTMPQHPYTVGLMGAIPSIDAPRARLAAIDGMVPAATAMPAGCRFAARCPFADARCRDEAPPLAEVSPGHLSRCWKAPLEVLAASLPALETVA